MQRLGDGCFCAVEGCITFPGSFFALRSGNIPVTAKIAGIPSRCRPGYTFRRGSAHSGGAHGMRSSVRRHIVQYRAPHRPQANLPNAHKQHMSHSRLPPIPAEARPRSDHIPCSVSRHSSLPQPRCALLQELPSVPLTRHCSCRSDGRLFCLPRYTSARPPHPRSHSDAIPDRF